MHHKARNYTRSVLNDTDCLEHLSTYYPQAAAVFSNIKAGAHKADLCRSALLYSYGGAYFDIKTILLDSLPQILNATGNASLTTVLSIVPGTIFNGVLLAVPRHPIFRSVIQYFIDHNGHIENYLDITRHMHAYITADLGYAPRPGRHGQYYLLQEHCYNKPVTTHGHAFVDADKYCSFCFIQDTTKTVMKTRYADYPWHPPQCGLQRWYRCNRYNLLALLIIALCIALVICLKKKHCCKNNWKKRSFTQLLPFER